MGGRDEIPRFSSPLPSAQKQRQQWNRSTWIYSSLNVVIKYIIISSPLSRFSLATVVLSPVTVSSVHDWKSVDSGSRDEYTYSWRGGETEGNLLSPHRLEAFPLEPRLKECMSIWLALYSVLCGIWDAMCVLIRILKKSLAISPYAMKLSSSNAPPTTFWNHIFRHH
ncbi:hypothetical protein Lal_00014325 [Lupinus albus]|nr:hypothetical protein Lal_00014325 [Lupinus albus]